jgi:hypothetical protein
MEQTRDWNKDGRQYEEKGKNAESGGGEKGCAGLVVVAGNTSR